MGKAVHNDRKMYLPVWQEYDTGSGDHTKWGVIHRYHVVKI